MTGSERSLETWPTGLLTVEMLREASGICPGIYR